MSRVKVSITHPKFIPLLKQALEDLRIKAGERVEETAKENAPVNTGNYRSEINYDGANTITAQADYSAAIEYGAKAHEIRPKTAKALHFVKDGQDVFTQKVNHPETRPNPVMRNAAAKVQKEIPQIWQEVQKENGL